MPTLEFECTIAAPLERVWAFYYDPVHALPALTPPDVQATIESADTPVQVGSRVILNIRPPGLRGRRVRWVATIVEHRPPHPVAFGEEARFVDVQESGPFAAWRHEHDFERVDEKTTRMLDRVTYRVPLGPIGWVADVVFVRRKLAEMFRYRHEQTKRLLERDERE
jgi:ligand-binding SRPBCC domain-containing protein